MNVSKVTTIMAAVVCTAIAYSQAGGATEDEPAITVIATNEAAVTANVGKKVVAIGVVVTATKGSEDTARFLNFGNDTTGLSALIVPAVYPDLKPLGEYEGKIVKVTGKLETYKDKTQIRVSRISQIEVVPDDKIQIRAD